MVCTHTTHAQPRARGNQIGESGHRKCGTGSRIYFPDAGRTNNTPNFPGSSLDIREKSDGLSYAMHACRWICFLIVSSINEQGGEWRGAKDTRRIGKLLLEIWPVTCNFEWILRESSFSGLRRIYLEILSKYFDLWDLSSHIISFLMQMSR